VERSVCCPTGWAGPAAKAEKAQVDNFVLAQLLASGLIRLTLFLWLFTWFPCCCSGTVTWLFMIPDRVHVIVKG